MDVNREAGRVLDGARVLVVEDDFLISMDLESTLLEAGAQVVGLCRTVQDALALIAAAEIAVAVLDVRLGRESIAPVARQLAECGIPFVFYTAQLDNDPTLTEWPQSKLLPKPAPSRMIVNVIADQLH
jgi:DNA-binding response OmpR family regulator